MIVNCNWIEIAVFGFQHLVCHMLWDFYQLYFSKYFSPLVCWKTKQPSWEKVEGSWFNLVPDAEGWSSGEGSQWKIWLHPSCSRQLAEWLWMRIDECGPKYLWGLLERQLATCLVAIWVSLCELCEPVTGLCVVWNLQVPLQSLLCCLGAPYAEDLVASGRASKGSVLNIVVSFWHNFERFFWLWIKTHTLLRRNSLLVIVGFSWKHTGAS